MAEYSRVHVHPELFPMDVLAFSRTTSMREDPRLDKARDRHARAGTLVQGVVSRTAPGRQPAGRRFAGGSTRLHGGQFDPSARRLSAFAASAFPVAEAPPPANARPQE